MKKKKAYICFSLDAKTPEEFEENIRMAKQYATEVSNMLDCWAVAIQSFLSELLEDNNPERRKLAMDFKIRTLATCDMLVVCGIRITADMAMEMEAASDLGIPVLRYAEGKLYIKKDDFLLQMLLYLIVSGLLSDFTEEMDSSEL